MSSTTPDNLFSVNRVEAFSDGVLAIVITLLVLEIKLPVLPHGAGTAETIQVLLNLTPQFISFLLGFLFVAVFWVHHHLFFSLIRSVDWGMLWLNNTLLLLLCFIPFPTAFLGDHPDNPVAVCFFALVFMSAGLAFNAMWRHARKTLAKEDQQLAFIANLAVKDSLVGPLAYTTAAVLAFISPIASWVIFFAVPFYYSRPVKKMISEK